MTYETKYRALWATPTADCRLRIQQQGYSGSVTNLNLATEPFKVIWRQKNRQNVTLPLHISVGRIRVFGDSKGEQLQEVFDAGDTEFRVLFERDVGGWALEWQGFVSPSLWKDNPYRQTDVVELDATDGLALLEDRSLELTQDTDLYTIAREILRGVHELDVAATMEWYPYREGNQLNADELPLAELLVDEQAFDELEPVGGPGKDFESTGKRNQRRALEAILERFGMELFQSRGEWRIRQRHRIQGDGTINVWPDKDAVDNNDRFTRDLNRELGALKPREKPRSLVRRLRETKSVYTYDDLGELVSNPSFEDPLSTWSTEGDVSRLQYSNTADPDDYPSFSEEQTQEDTRVIEMDGGNVPLSPNDSEEGSLIEQEVPALLHDAGPRAALQVSWDVTDTVNSLATTETRIQLGDYYVQARRLTVGEDAAPADDGTLKLQGEVPGQDDVIIAPVDSTLRTGDGSGGGEGEVTLTQPARAGDTRLRGKITSEVKEGDYVLLFVWSDTMTSSFSGTREHFGLLNATLDYPTKLDSETLFNPQRLTMPLHTPDGTDLLGKELKFAVWSNDDSDSSATFHTYLDHVSIQQTIEGKPIDQTSYTLLDEQTGREIQITQLLGDGPTAEHPCALQLPGVEVTRDWKIGPYVYQEYPSGKLLEQVTAEAAMRQQRDTLQRRTHEVHLRNEEVWPQDVFTIDGDLYTVISLERTFGSPDVANVQLVRLKDSGTSGLKRTYKMESAGGGGVEGTTGGGGNGGGSGGSSETTWGLVQDKPSNLLARNGDDDGFTSTLPSTRQQLQEWIRTVKAPSSACDTRNP